MKTICLILLPLIFGCSLEDKTTEARPDLDKEDDYGWEEDMIHKMDQSVFSGEEFFAIYPFKGRVLKVEIVGEPETKHFNSGPILNIEIITNKGKLVRVKNVRIGKHAADNIEKLKAKGDIELPKEIWGMRDTALFD